MTSQPTPDPMIMQAVERLNYRVTVGDVASQAGMNVNLAERGLLALASEAGGHLQVAESGEVVYLFPKNFRDILRDKSFQLQLQEWWSQVWRVLFYLIRISFGIVLVLLIVAAFLAIIAIMIAASSSRDGDDRGGDDWGGGGSWGGGYWGFPDFWWIFYPDYGDRRERRLIQGEPRKLNFLESIFSFLFGDGNPNADLEKRRWKTIANVIRNNRGAVIAEQIAPYLDEVGSGFAQEYEEYMLPVLTRFNGRPEVSPDGQMVYHFPDLQTTVKETRSLSVPAYLKEALWLFSQATSGQIVLAASLGGVLLVLAVILNGMIAGGGLIAGGVGVLIRAIATVSLGYGAAYLTIPLIRYFWLKGRNAKVQTRNDQRQRRAMLLNAADDTVKQKLTYAQQFAAETVIQDSDLVYTTETDLIDQEIERSAQIDAEWEQRLNQSGSTPKQIPGQD